MTYSIDDLVGTDLEPGYEDVYFADTEDEHTASGPTHDYVGPSEDEIRARWNDLTERQQFVLGRLRGVNGDGHRYTLDEIAEAMGITNQAVSRIEQRALRQLGSLVS